MFKEVQKWEKKPQLSKEDLICVSSYDVQLYSIYLNYNNTNSNNNNNLTIAEKSTAVRFGRNLNKTVVNKSFI